MARPAMIMYSRPKAGIFHDVHAMDHDKPDMEIEDHGIESTITPKVLIGF